VKILTVMQKEPENLPLKKISTCYDI